MFTRNSTMSYTNNRQELKCKFLSCPCQKCVCAREDRLAAGINPALCDVPPERPAYKHTQTQDNKYCCKPYSSTCIIGPRYRRKYRGGRQQRKADTDEVKKSTHTRSPTREDCNSGKGCCNTRGNFTAFMINVISFMAFTIVALLLFWLKMNKWTYTLCIKTYHSNRKTQMLVGSIISLLLLAIICTYLMTDSTSTEESPQLTSCEGSNCATAMMKEFTVTITDDQSREIYRQSKWYAIPLDMKQPPTLLLYLRSLILKED